VLVAANSPAVGAAWLDGAAASTNRAAATAKAVLSMDSSIRFFFTDFPRCPSPKAVNCNANSLFDEEG
jgi:hypothetical protein